MSKVRATRHNGRKGSGGVFKAGHNDRTFNVENAEHIEPNRCIQNVYWDCYQGFNIADETGKRPERKFNFDEIEHAYYFRNFGDAVDAQNERHIQSRHKERCREIEDILKDPKICPEESVYQLGTKDGYEDPALFVQVASELFEEMGRRFGSNFQILDWALHMDEATPHIHERHVFFAKDDYGLLFPKQDRACQELGFELPDPSKPSSKFNSRKMSFDAEVRKLYIEIAEKYGVTIEKVPLEGRTHREKNDYIIAKQNEEIAKNTEILDELTLKISEVDTLIKEVTEVTYDAVVEKITESVREETTKSDIAVAEKYAADIKSPTCKLNNEQKTFAGYILNGLIDRLKRKAAELTEIIKKALKSPDVKQKNIAEITEAARPSVLKKLASLKKDVDMESRARDSRPHDHERGAR